MRKTDYDPKNFSRTGAKKQSRNRYSSAGITQREADRLYKAMVMIEKLSQKNNLFVGYKRTLQRISGDIYTLLDDTDRL